MCFDTVGRSFLTARIDGYRQGADTRLLVMILLTPEQHTARGSAAPHGAAAGAAQLNVRRPETADGCY